MTFISIFFFTKLKDNFRLERLKNVLKFKETTDIQIPSLKIEEEWCLFHNLVQSSLQHVANICMILEMSIQVLFFFIII